MNDPTFSVEEITHHYEYNRLLHQKIQNIIQEIIEMEKQDIYACRVITVTPSVFMKDLHVESELFDTNTFKTSRRTFELPLSMIADWEKKKVNVQKSIETYQKEELRRLLEKYPDFKLPFSQNDVIEV